MAKRVYKNINGVARRCRKMYLGVDDIARKIRKGYIGDANGKARLFFTFGEPTKVETSQHISSRYGMVSASVGTFGIFTGGTNALGNSSVGVTVFTDDLVQGSAEDASENRTSAATVGEYALFAGDSDTIDVYNASLVKTTVMLPLTLRRSAGVSFGQYALFGGGHTANNNTDIVYAFNSSLTRSTAPALSQARYSLSGAANESYAIFAGGTAELIDGTNNSVATTDAYDRSLTKAQTVASLGSARTNPLATYVGNYAIIGTGYASGSTTRYADAYDRSLSRKSMYISTAPYGTQYGAANLAKEYALFSGSSTYGQSITAFDTSLARTMPVERSVAVSYDSAVSVGEYVIFAGGRLDTGADGTVDVITLG